MTTYVLDTSVILKWYYRDNEDNVEQALQLLNALKDEQVSIIIPDELILELLYAFLKSKQLQKTDAQDLMRNFLSLPITSKEPSESVLFRIPELSNQYILTSYDAVFVALAEEEMCQLISDDKNGHGKVIDGTVRRLETYRTIDKITVI